jgi:hypothetical protein
VTHRMNVTPQARRGEPVAIPGRLRGVGGQGAVGAVVLDELKEINYQGSRHRFVRFDHTPTQVSVTPIRIDVRVDTGINPASLRAASVDSAKG